MNIRALFTLLLLCYLGLSLHIQAQTPSKQIEIKGYILDRERNPIPLATVRIANTSIGTTANLKGYYSLKCQPVTDSLTIVYSSIGYKTSKRTLPSLIASTQINVELGEDTKALEAVIVSTQDRSRPINTQRLDPGKINLGTSPAGAVESLVGTFSGVAQKNELSNQYTVRGGNFDENLIYINGIEIYRPLLARSAEQEGLSAINPDLTQELTFSAGGFTADYGDKSSSVLDVRYKQPDSLVGGALIGLLESRIYLGSRHGKLSHISGIRYKRSSALLSTLDTKAEYDPHYFDAQTAIVYRPNSRVKLSLLGHANGTNYDFVPRVRQTTFGTLHNAKQLSIFFDGQEVDRFRTYLGAITLEYQPSQRWRHSFIASGFRSQEHETFDITGEYILSDAQPEGSTSTINSNDPLQNQANALGIGRDRSHARNRMNYDLLSLTLRSQVQLSPRHRLLIGFEGRGERIHEQTNEWAMRDSMGYTMPLSSEVLTARYSIRDDKRMNTTRISAFAESHSSYQIEHVGRLQVQAGLRGSWWSWSRELILSPRLGIRLQPEDKPDLEFKFNGGVYHQAPFYRELKQERTDRLGQSSIELNRHIRSQSTLLLLTGGEYNFKLINRPFRLSAEAYYKFLWNQNPYIQDNIKLRYLGSNTGTGYIIGLDTKLYGEFVEGVDSWLSLSLIRGRQRISGGEDVPLPNAPAYNLALFFQDYFPGFKPIRLSLRAVYSAGLPVVHPRGTYDSVAFTSSPYRRVDIGLTYRITERGNGSRPSWWHKPHLPSIDLGIDVLNLFDMVNTSSYYWVTDAYSNHYAVPNYLTRRAWNFSLHIVL